MKPKLIDSFDKHLLLEGEFGEELKPFTKKRYNEIKKKSEENNIKILTPWKKGLKYIELEPIILGYRD